MKKQTLLYLLIILSLSINILAQNINELRINGKAEVVSGELISKEIRDKNGEVCAGLMILSDLDGLSFDSNNGIVKSDNDKPGQNLLFLSSNERVVTVFKTGYKPFKIILNEYGIRLKNGEIWKIEITGDKTIDKIPVNFIIKPEGAVITIDGMNKGSISSEMLSIGEHTIKIEKEGFASVTNKIMVSAASNLFNYNLTEIDPIPVTLSSNPKGAKIYIDNAEKGVTDNAYFLYPGEYSLKLILSGYLDVNEKIIVAEGKENKYKYSLSKNSGILQISVTPEDAEVYVNKERKTNFSSIEMPPGKYKIEVKKENYYDASETMDLKIGETTKKVFALNGRYGNLQVKVLPVEAECRLIQNSKTIKTWNGLSIQKNLLQGMYQLEVKTDGYETKTETVKIEEGQTQKIDIELKKALANTNEIEYYGKKYHTVKIGNQTWLKENLNVGTMIQGSSNQADNEKIEKYCYDNKPENCEKYGGLYQWDEAMLYKADEKAQGICPSGWHIPTTAEYEALKAAVNDSRDAFLEKGQLTGNNLSGFSALLAGYRNNYGGFYFAGNNAYFWSSSERDAGYASTMGLDLKIFNIYSINNYKTYGFSARCSKD